MENAKPKQTTLMDVYSIGKLFSRKSRIFKERETLTEKFIPNKLPFREEYIEWFATNLYPALGGETPPHMLVLGEKGTGKTATVMRVMTELQSIADVLVGYVVANGSPFQVLVNLAENFSPGLIPPRGTGFLNAITRFKNFLDGRTAIIVLDEMDKMLGRQYSDDLLYFLSRWPNTCVIGISNNFNVKQMIRDSRVQSSFRTRNIIFERYTVEQLEEILRYRAELAFRKGALDEGVIPYCAAVATHRGGDVRYALDLLLYAGDMAVKEDAEKVCVRHVEIAIDALEDEVVRDSVRGLSDVHKCLLLAVLALRMSSPSSVYELCNRILNEYVGKKLSTRRLESYLGELELYGFVNINRKGRGRGKGVEWIVTFGNVDPSLVESVLRESFGDELVNSALGSLPLS